MAEILNKTAMVTEFILVGFARIRWLQILLFWVILLTYLLTIMGNLLIIYITLVDHRLHTPMYFFLRNFSVLEIGFTSSAIPKALFNLASGNNTISLAGCFSQAFFYFILGTAEFFILSTMSFDRYVAICNPLRYTVIMNSQLCTQLVVGSWIISFLYVITPLILLFRLPFCGPNIINHFFCDNMPLIKLACINTQFLELMDFLMATFTVLGTLAITIISYIKIIAAVMHIPSRTGRQKAFSTCASHIVVVFITYGSCIFMYVKPTRSGGLDLSKTVGVLNNVVSPLLNPFIYSLRNKQVKTALKDACGWR
ncbi:olfactory receptor 49-like [Crotalus tigris]|uniref:olfactory receptor 49-like n=1 Tax=Crotalus tigris TaxID=88082 RepID=UPI00192FB0AF|nr:olfactory receptor 49-like [Crotalus tigris]XP_039200383.1 olfactory receptor 49-like [Crotalus tigris]